MMLGSLLMAIGCVVDFNGRDFWTFALGEGLLALGMTLTSGADSAYLYDLLLSYGREHEYRSHEGSATAAKLLGAAAALVAGGFVGRAAPAATYAATSCVCAAAALVAMMMREPPIQRDDDSDFLHGMAHSARAVVTRPPLLFAVGFSVLVFTLLAGAATFTSRISTAPASAPRRRLVLALLSVIGAVGAQRIESVRRRLGETGLVWGLPLAMAIAPVLGRFVAVWGIALLAVQSLVNGIYSPFSKELLNREIADSGQRATVLQRRVDGAAPGVRRVRADRRRADRRARAARRLLPVRGRRLRRRVAADRIRACAAAAAGSSTSRARSRRRRCRWRPPPRPSRRASAPPCITDERRAVAAEPARVRRHELAGLVATSAIRLSIHLQNPARLDSPRRIDQVSSFS